jgi:phosphopantetheine adenylyltransferase
MLYHRSQSIESLLVPSHSRFPANCRVLWLCVCESKVISFDLRNTRTILHFVVLPRMHSIRLSCSACVASNCKAVVQWLTTHSESDASTTPKAASPAAVFLDIDNTPYTEVIEQVKSMYDACAEVNPATSIDLILRKSDRTLDEPLTAGDLPEALGYHLHHHVALGGTFDRLHVGHKLLLTTSLLSTKTRLRVGVTGPELLKKKKFAELLQPFNVRCETVLEFLKKQRSDLQFDVVELTEPTGGTTTIEDVTAMVCSPETLPTIDGINKARAEKGFSPVVPVLIPYVGGNETTRVSSTQLRERAQKQHS